MDDYAFVPHSALYNTYALTVTAWVKTSQATGEAGLVNKYVANSLNGWNLFLFNGAVRAWFFRDNANYVWDGGRGLNGGFVADGQWHHVALAVDGSGGRVYVDGVLRDSRAWTGTAGNATTTQELRFGSYPGSGFYHGLLDEFMVWGRTLGQAEINAFRSSSLVSIDADLRIHCRVSEGGGTTTRNSAAGALVQVTTLTNGLAWAPGVLLRPGVLTLAPSSLASHSGRLNGTANAGGTNALAWFEWGSTTNYGNVTPVQSAGSGGNPTNFLHVLTGLPSGVLVNYRASASNALGLAHGSNATFTPPAINLTQEREGHTATLLPNGRVLVTGGYGECINGLGFATNSAELFDPSTGVWTPTASMAGARGFHTATLLRNGRVLVVGGSGAELYDPPSGTWSGTNPPLDVHNLHTATLLTNGRVLVAGGVGNFPELYDPAVGTWTPTGRLLLPRSRHTATLLSDGRVLVAGGETNSSGRFSATSELYDPLAGTWTPTGPMNAARGVHTATLLPNGQVLAVGGTDGVNYLNNAERYNPVTGTWTRVGETLLHARGYHSATLLPRGAVLVAGGWPDFPSTAEVLELNGDVWRAAGPLLGASRWAHTATLLPGGKVLLAGGYDPGTDPIAGVELVDVHTPSWTPATPMASDREGHSSTLLPDGRVVVAGFGNTGILIPTNGTWLPAAPLHTPRRSHTATLLPGGRVLVAGGTTGAADALAGVEWFDPSGFWVDTGPLTTNRSQHSATLLPNGRVLVAGGVPGGDSPLPHASAELYDPASGQWTRTGPMRTNRTAHTATLLPNGKVLVVGGNVDSFHSVNTAEIYDLGSGVWTPAPPMALSRSGHRATLLPNGSVLITGGISGDIGTGMPSAEVFDPGTGTWGLAPPMANGRARHTATLLASGQVLVVGGFGAAYLATAELYDPATRTWSLAGSRSAGTSAQAATLLPNGRVLITGGWNGSTGVNNADLFDSGLGFVPVWQPDPTNAPTQLAPGTSLFLGGLRFRGVSSASSGGNKDSPSDHPVVQLRAVESERTTFLLSTNWSLNSYHSLPVSGVAPGWTMATMFVNGMPCAASRLVEITPAVTTAPRLTAPMRLPNGSLQFHFNNSVGGLFGLLAATNIALPVSQWTALGCVPEIAPGRFQVTDPQATNHVRRFYRVQAL